MPLVNYRIKYIRKRAYRGKKGAHLWFFAFTSKKSVKLPTVKCLPPHLRAVVADQCLTWKRVT